MTERSDWFDIGDVVIRRATFRTKATGALVDPTTAACTVTNPDQVTTTPAVVRDSIGVYHVAITPTIPGIWQLRWVGTGAAAAAEPDHFLVRAVNV